MPSNIGMRPDYNIQQAQAYRNSLPSQEQARIDSTGGPSVQWLTNQINSGTPGAIGTADGQSTAPPAVPGQWNIGAGYTNDPQGINAAPATDWQGQRMPNPSELRRLDMEQGPIGGPAAAVGQDFNNMSDMQLESAIRDNWNRSLGWWRPMNTSNPFLRGTSLGTFLW